MAVLLFLLVFVVSFTSIGDSQTRVVQKPDLKVGDTWVYLRNGENVTKEGKQIKDGLVYVAERNNCNRELMVYNLEWAEVESCGMSARRGNVRFMPASFVYYRQYLKFPVLFPRGKAGLQNTELGGISSPISKGKQLAGERVTVPAGTFDTLKVEITVTNNAGVTKSTIWYSPEANNFVKWTGAQEFELVSYSRGK